MKKLTLLLLVMSCTALLSAGRYAGDFMMIGAGVRSLGMGGAFAGLADDGSALYWNPAGIAQLRDSEVSAMHAFMYNGLASYDHVTFCQPLPSDVTIGLNVTRLTVSDIPLFDESYLIGTNVDQRINNSEYQLPGIPDGDFNAHDDLYQFAFAKHIHYDLNMGWMFFSVPLDFYAGGNVKFIKRTILDNQGSGTGLDFGLKVKTDLGVLFDWDVLGKLDFGMNFQDIGGTQISWDTFSEHKDEVLFNTKLGVAVSQPIPPLDSELTLAYDYDYVYEGCSHYGLQFSYKDLGALRAGYYDTNFTCGASVNVYGVGIDYALITNPVGITNRIGLRLSF
jgi:hypothetical protein